jgi:transposase-like protein
MTERLIEVITGRERRRRWRIEEKLRIVGETFEPGASVGQIAARHEVIFCLRRREFTGEVFARSDDASDLPDDITALRAMVLEQRAELAVARSGLIEQRYEIETLKARLARLLRVTFGRSSEKLNARVER